MNPAAGAVSSPPSWPDPPVRTHTVSPSATPPRTTQPPARTSTRICNPRRIGGDVDQPRRGATVGGEHLRVVTPAHRTRRAGEPFVPDHRPVLVAQAIQTPRHDPSLPRHPTPPTTSRHPARRQRPCRPEHRTVASPEVGRKSGCVCSGRARRRRRGRRRSRASPHSAAQPRFHYAALIPRAAELLATEPPNAADKSST